MAKMKDNAIIDEDMKQPKTMYTTRSANWYNH